MAERLPVGRSVDARLIMRFFLKKIIGFHLAMNIVAISGTIGLILQKTTLFDKMLNV